MHHAMLLAMRPGAAPALRSIAHHAPWHRLFETAWNLFLAHVVTAAMS
jgi:hypothetical protein